MGAPVSQRFDLRLASGILGPWPSSSLERVQLKYISEEPSSFLKNTSVSLSI